MIEGWRGIYTISLYREWIALKAVKWSKCHEWERQIGAYPSNASSGE